MLNPPEGGTLCSKVETQSESSDYSCSTENSLNNSAYSESSNPLSIQNLLNHHSPINYEFQYISANSQEVQVIQENMPKKSNQNRYIKNGYSHSDKKSGRPDITLEQFIEYLNLKFNGDKTKKITKDTLNIFYKQIQLFLNLGSLTRSEKRSKIKVFMKLYRYANNVMYFLEYKPQIFLDPILLHIKFKINNRKKYQVKLGQNNQPSNCLNPPSELK